MRVLYVGGSTGGHLMPGAAVAEALERVLPGARSLFLTTSRDAERWCAGAVARFETAPAPDVPWHGAAAKALFPGRSLLAAHRIMDVLGQFRPHVVLGLGSYNSVLPVLLARWLGIGTAVIEANVVPGRAVRALAPVVDRVLVNWGEAIPRLRPRRAVATGLPVRSRLFSGSRREAATRLGLSPGRCTLLAMGGSQGALPLNRALFGALERVRSAGVDLQVLHLTGSEHLAAARSRGLADYRAFGFLERMEDAYAVADFVLSRAGSAVAELTALGLPSILVPYPYAADRHQHANAHLLAQAGAAIAIDQSDLTDVALAEAIVRLAANPGLRRRMAGCARTQGRPEAATAAAAELAELGGFASRVDRAVLRASRGCRSYRSHSQAA